MRLSVFTDYSLRVLMYLGMYENRLVTVAEIAAAYGVSEHHLMKVIQELARGEYIETTRGRGGGVRLAKPANGIVLGQVVRQTESDMTMAECFGTNSTCRLEPRCRLKGILNDALTAMLTVLDGYTLADLLPPTSHTKPPSVER